MSSNIELDDSLLDEMLGDFLDESEEIIGSLNENLLKLDECINSLEHNAGGSCDENLMNEMFRGAHSLKGLSGMLGLNDINQLTHKVENIFDAARNNKLLITRDVMNTIFLSIDKISCMVDCLKNPDSILIDCNEVIHQIEKLLQDAGAEHVQESAEETERKFLEMQAAMAGESLPVPITAESPHHFADIVDESDASERYLAIFIDESMQALDELDEVLVSDPETMDIETLMIQCHKIKGSAASLGLNRAAKLSHFMEDLLQDMLQAKEALTENRVEALLRCTNSLRSYIESLKTGTSDTESFNEAYTLLLLVSNQNRPLPSAADKSNGLQDLATKATISDVSDTARQKIAAVAPEGGVSFIVQVQLTLGMKLSGLKGFLIQQRLSDLGTVFYCDPPADSLAYKEDLSCLLIGLTTLRDEAAISRHIHIAGVEQVAFESVNRLNCASMKNNPEQSTAVAPQEKTKSAPLTNEPMPPQPATQKPAKPQKPATPETNKKPTETLRVDIERLDHLMNLAGQLVINKARFSQIGEGLKSLTANKQAHHSLADVIGIVSRLSNEISETNGKHPKALDLDNLTRHINRMQIGLGNVQKGMEQFAQSRLLVNDLTETVHQMDRVTEGIQKTVMDTRMVPVGPLFRRFKRVIRDITHVNGKEIQLVINGENTELDKRMIDELSDPLIHMIRNCADHGIESPEDRLAAGKLSMGTVTLDAFHSGSSILIQIRDDGKGLDSKKIRQKAIEKGLVTENDAQKMSEHQIFQLIWEPGLSTAEKVTEVSGRGMGMDIVQTKIEEINGTVELESKVGVGTTITIKLPLTLAILPSLLVEIDGDVIAMPVESVSEIVRVSEEKCSTIHGLRTASVRGRVIPMVLLSELFSWNHAPLLNADHDGEEQSLVILESDGAELGLVVDRLLGEEDIVIKSMDENYCNVIGIAGASILGDGRVSLILDVATVLEMSAQHNDPSNFKQEITS